MPDFSYIVASTGDALSQVLEGVTGVNYKRMTTFGLSQFFYFGPVLHHWFGIIDRVGNLPYLRKPDTPKWQVVLAKTLFDQTVGTVLVISGFFMFFGFMSSALQGTLLSTGFGALAQQGADKIGSDLWPTMLANWRLWPAANAVNFAFVPLKFQVLFSNLIAVIWNVYLSGVVKK